MTGRLLNTLGSCVVWRWLRFWKKPTTPTPRIRLKALEMLGKVTEVGLFTERIEIKKTELSDVELDERIKQKLEVIQKTIEVDATEVESVEDEQDH
jgi:hypothetical protein